VKRFQSSEEPIMADDLGTYRVAAVQMDPKLGDVAGNRETILARLKEAVGNGADLVVFPECALTGYGFGSRDEAMAVAEPVPSGTSLMPIAYECARVGAYAVVGMLECDGDRLFNACVLVGQGGVIGSYRKVHLPYLGVDRFADPGDRPFAVHDAGGLRVGMHICYDGSFPEVGRVLSLLGADILVLPTNWPRHSECAAEHMMICRAMENHVYTMAVNRVGEEAGFRFIGRSSIVAAGGDVLATAGAEEETILYATVEPARARNKRLVRVPGLHEINRIADRRPRFYAPITAPNGRE
jgi:predicted amidohydrolase